jgi:hypothetical protein
VWSGGPQFRRTVLLPSSRSKSKTSKIPLTRRRLFLVGFLLFGPEYTSRMSLRNIDVLLQDYATEDRTFPSSNMFSARSCFCKYYLHKIQALAPLYCKDEDIMFFRNGGNDLPDSMKPYLRTKHSNLEVTAVTPPPPKFPADIHSFAVIASVT